MKCANILTLKRTSWRSAATAACTAALAPPVAAAAKPLLMASLRSHSHRQRLQRQADNSADKSVHVFEQEVEATPDGIAQVAAQAQNLVHLAPQCNLQMCSSCG
jgi:hypothetical protein